jgi:hypothetical protein
MSALIHGIELDAQGKPARQHFGIVNLLWLLEGTKVTEQSLQDWVARFRFGQPFWHEWRHFYQSVCKFDRAAGHVARLRETIDGALGRHSERVRRFTEGETTEPPDPASDPDQLTMLEANQDLPLLWDGMLFYLRIQADSYARLVRYLYELLLSVRCIRFDIISCSVAFHLRRARPSQRDRFYQLRAA